MVSAAEAVITALIVIGGVLLVVVMFSLIENGGCDASNQGQQHRNRVQHLQSISKIEPLPFNNQQLQQPQRIAPIV